jgi:hypothetical protein
MARFKVTYPTNGLEAGDIVEADVCPQWLKGKCVSLPDEPVRVLEVASPIAKRQTVKSPRD